MWEKIRVIFTIPELRMKIFFTLIAPGGVSHRVAHSAARLQPDAVAEEHRQPAALHDDHVSCLQRQQFGHRPRSSAWASCLTSRPRLSSSSWAASIRRWKNCKRKARRAARKSTNILATPPSSSASARAGSTSVALRSGGKNIDYHFLNDPADSDQRLGVLLATHLRADGDRRHDLPDVAGRADRRIWHRQRHQPADHGRTFSPGCHGRA